MPLISNSEVDFSIVKMFLIHLCLMMCNLVPGAKTWEILFWVSIINLSIPNCIQIHPNERLILLLPILKELQSVCLLQKLKYFVASCVSCAQSLPRFRFFPKSVKNFKSQFPIAKIFSQKFWDPKSSFKLLSEHPKGFILKHRFSIAHKVQHPFRNPNLHLSIPF